uniref:NAD(P)H-dependent oxidoreductase n=1 Tax=Janibacter limosus TaxID=53458 RepID=A0AC61U322_9MICO|nr:NAD(P)H-dependent oxidoreductase [Janibacter limosus]
MNVLVLLGSLREGSTNRALADAAVAHLPEGSTATVFDRGADLPHYSEDLDREGHVPEVATELRDAVAAADGLIVVTPEYNGTLSSVVKNTIDWVSRPRGTAAIDGTPAVVMAASGSPAPPSGPARTPCARSRSPAPPPSRSLWPGLVLRGLRRRPARRRGGGRPPFARSSVARRRSTPEPHATARRGPAHRESGRPAPFVMPKPARP